MAEYRMKNYIAHPRPIRKRRGFFTIFDELAPKKRGPRLGVSDWMGNYFVNFVVNCIAAGAK